MRVLAALRRSWVLATVVFAIVMAATALFAASAPRAYTATAIIALVPEAETSPGGDLVQLAVPTYAELADSASVITEMADRFEVDRRELGSSVSGDVIPSTNTVLITVEWDDPETAARLANGVTDQLETFSERDPLLSAYVAAPAEPPLDPSFPPLGLTWVSGTIAAIVAAVAAAQVRAIAAGSTRTSRPAAHRGRRPEFND